MRLPVAAEMQFVFDRGGHDFTERDREVRSRWRPHLVRLYEAAETRRRLRAALASRESSPGFRRAARAADGARARDPRTASPRATRTARSQLGSGSPPGRCASTWTTRTPSSAFTRAPRRRPSFGTGVGAVVEDGFDVVAVGVEHEGGVVARVVLRPLARRAVVAEAGLERCAVECVHGRTIGRRERQVHVLRHGPSLDERERAADAVDVEAPRRRRRGRVARPSARPSRRRAGTRRGRGRGSRDGRARSRRSRGSRVVHGLEAVAVRVAHEARRSRSASSAGRGPGSPSSGGRRRSSPATSASTCLAGLRDQRKVQVPGRGGSRRLPIARSSHSRSIRPAVRLAVAELRERELVAAAARPRGRTRPTPT